MAKVRESNFELLRIFCIIGIVFMHSLPILGEELSVGNLVLLKLTNSMLNVGVTCFILISGYFGIRFSLEKLIRLDLMIIFYGVLYNIIKIVLGYDVLLGDWFSAFFPIISKKFWYLSCYFFMTILAEYVNLFVERLSQTQLKRALLILLFLFSVLPTCFVLSLMEDSGKGLVQMIIVYWIGRYICLYDNRKYKRSKLLLLFFINVCITFALDYTATLVTAKMAGKFYRDCSIFIIISAVLLFQFFRTLTIQSRIINYISGSVLGVYVFSSAVQKVMDEFIALDEYAYDPMAFLLVTIYVVCVIVICFLVDFVRRKVLSEAEKKLADRLADTIRKLIVFGKSILEYGYNLFLKIVT